MRTRAGPNARQFENLRATELFCKRCGGMRPVRERLLLVLPSGELHEYRCAACGESVGTREVKESFNKSLSPRAGSIQSKC